MTETASEATKNLEQWNGKRVTVVRNLPEPNEAGDSSVEIEGLVQVGNDMGILIKPKGKVTFDLIPIDEIEEVFEKAEESKELKASKLKPVKRENVKRHLLDRHGYTLEWVNGVTDEQAETHHDQIDHVASKLGHVHVAEEDKPAEGEASTADESAAGDEA